MIKKYLIFIFVIFGNCLMAQEQTFEWAKAILNSTNLSQDIAVNSQGDIYIVGSFKNVPDFNPGDEVFSFPSTNNNEHGYVLKLDSDGNFIWAKRIVSTDRAVIGKIVFDNEGNFYLSGFFAGTMDLDMGPGIANFTYVAPPPPLLGVDDFLAKYDVDGNYIWGKVFDNNMNISSNSLSVDNNGNLYFGGSFMHTPDFDPGNGVYNLTWAGGVLGDIFVSKLDTNGNFSWAKQIGGPGLDKATSIVVSNDGHIYVSGHFTGGNVDFDPGNDVFILQPSQPFNGSYREDTFVLKLTLSGDFVWAKKLGGEREDRPNAIAIDSQGNIVTMGYFFGTADFDPSLEQEYLLTSFQTGFGAGVSAFITTLDSHGNFVWAKKIDTPNGMTIRKAVTHQDGNILFGGIYKGTITDGDNTITSQYSNLDESFICKLNISGDMVWIKAIKGSSGFVNSLFGLCFDDEKSIYATGLFRGIVDMNLDEGVFNLDSNFQSTYILKLSIENELSEEDPQISEILLFPNPSNGIINIFVHQSLINSDVHIYNILGQSISQFKINKVTTEKYLDKGLYFVEIKNDKKRWVKKVIIN